VQEKRRLLTSLLLGTVADSDADADADAMQMQTRGIIEPWRRDDDLTPQEL